MKAFEQFCWISTAIMAVLGSVRMLNLWLTSTVSAPQYAAEAGGILAMVVVPYVFSRAVQQARRNRAET